MFIRDTHPQSHTHTLSADVFSINGYIVSGIEPLTHHESGPSLQGLLVFFKGGACLVSVTVANSKFRVLGLPG